MMTFLSIINRAIYEHYTHYIKPICLLMDPTKCHVLAQFPNCFQSKQGVHKLIVAEQSKSLFMTS